MTVHVRQAVDAPIAKPRRTKKGSRVPLLTACARCGDGKAIHTPRCRDCQCEKWVGGRWRECERCHKPMRQIRATKRYCSPRCRIAAHRARSVTSPVVSVTQLRESAKTTWRGPFI